MFSLRCQILSNQSWSIVQSLPLVRYFFKLRSSHFQKPSQNVIPRQNSILNIVYCYRIFGFAIKNCARLAKIDMIVSCKDWYELRQMSTYHLRRLCLNVLFTTSSKSSRWSSNSEFACQNNSQIQPYFFKIIQKIQKKKKTSR